MSFAGREAELRTLSQALGALRSAPAPSVVTIVGEAGIGKSALLAAIGPAARDAGVRVLSARAAEHERDVPFALFADALGDVVAGMSARRRAEMEADLAAVLPGLGVGHQPAESPGAVERFRLHRAGGALIEQLGRERPLALVFDDVHWADAASVELLVHLLHRPPDAPVLLVIAMRSTDAASRLVDAARLLEAHEHLALGPLDDQAALAAVRDDVSDDATARRVVVEAGGHPLFLRELARASRPGAGPLPATVVASIALELARLEPGVRALADGAAVAGDPFDPEFAAAAADLDTAAALAALDELVAADLVRDVPDARLFAFRHPLVRRAVYDATPPAWRLGAHDRVARRLAELGADLITRAYHVERSARPADENAIELLCGAAAQALGRSPDAAAHWYGAALRLLPAGDLERRGALLGDRALAQSQAGRLADCRVTLLEALALGPDDVRLAIACARVERFIGAVVDSHRRLLSALNSAGADERAAVELELAVSSYLTGDLEHMGEHAAAARDAPGPTGIGGIAMSALGHVWTASQERVDAELAEAERRYAQLDDMTLRADPAVVFHLGMAELLAEHFQRASAIVTRGIGCARGGARAGMLPNLLYLRGLARRSLLDLDGSVADLEAAEESARLLGLAGTEQWAVGAVVLTHFERADAPAWARAAAAYERLLDGVEDTVLSANGRCNMAATRIDHDPERALRELLAAGGEQLERADPTWRVFLLRALVRAAITLGRIDDARRWATLAQERATTSQLPASGARAACARAEVLLAADDGTALDVARDAVTRAVTADTPSEILECTIVLARARAASGDRDGAIAALDEVVARAGAAGAVRLRDIGARELRRLGIRVNTGARRASASGSPLSPREQEVAALVAQGKANREVAAALFISEKTIEYHLSHVYEKLGLRGRVELAGHVAGA